MAYVRPGFTGGVVMRAVLVVDDDRDILSAIQEALADEGFTVWTAGGGERALEVLRGAELPGLVLLDGRMNGIDGSSVLSWIRADPRARGIPVVFMSADRRVVPPDGVRMLPKPFDLEALIRVVSELLVT